MTHKFIPIVFAAALWTPAALAQPAAESVFPSDSEIRKLLAQRIDDYHQGVGMVAGVVDPSGRRIVAYGALDKGDPRPLDGNTVFEIGSVTKVFTALALAEMARRGEVNLADPVAKYLPADVKVPRRGNRQITLEDLAAHTSGLPRMPSNFKPGDPANPYADYTADLLYRFLSSYELPREIGSLYEYSNLGAGLLGHALARRAGMDYEALVLARICRPLGLANTRITLSPEMKSRLAAGHNDKLERVPGFEFDALAGAGALRSTANDMLSFLAAAMGPEPSPLAEAFPALLRVRIPMAMPHMQGALGWQTYSRGGPEIVWKDGGTFGYSAFIGYDAKRHAGVVLLSNTFTLAGTMTGVSDLGLHLLDPQFPLNGPPEKHREISVAPKTLDGYTGRYQLTSDMVLDVTAADGRLAVQATGQAKLDLFPESEKEFFTKIGGIRIEFQTDSQGRATGLTLRQGGTALRAPRIEGDTPPPLKKDHKEISLDPAVLDRYVGRYQLGPSFIVTITRQDSHIYAQATGQPKFEIFAEGEKEFFLKVVDAQIAFVTDDHGKVTELVLHQNGAHQAARRID
jgi:CubicO group peptidase (beta-lactamase class C family)